MSDRYVLDSAGVRTLNATIARVRNLPGNPLNLNSRHRQVMTEATGGNNEYNGYFKVIDDSTYDESGEIVEARIKVIDGKNPDGQFCGYTDLGSVPVKTIENPAGKNIYLTAWWVQSYAGFELDIVALAPSEMNLDCYYLLAEVGSNMKINQRWTGEVVNFGERYVI